MRATRLLALQPDLGVLLTALWLPLQLTWNADATEHIEGQASKVLLCELVDRACTVDDTRDKITLSCDANAIIEKAFVDSRPVIVAGVELCDSTTLA